MITARATLRRTAPSRHWIRCSRVRSMLLVAAIAGGQAANAQTAAGVGARSCDAFSRALGQDENVAIDSYVAWSQGFISGFNWANVRERNVQIDAAGIINWLGAFCAANPTHRIYSAIQELIQLETH